MYCRRGIALACLGAAIYAVGGLDDSTCYSLVERYDPSVDQWTMVDNMNIPRGGVGVTALKVGHILVFASRQCVYIRGHCSLFSFSIKQNLYNL